MGGETLNDAATTTPASTPPSVSSRETADVVPPARPVPSKAPKLGTENGDPQPATDSRASQSPRNPSCWPPPSPRQTQGPDRRPGSGPDDSRF